jgi:hypothetical protein
MRKDTTRGTWGVRLLQRDQTLISRPLPAHCEHRGAMNELADSMAQKE